MRDKKDKEIPMSKEKVIIPYVQYFSISKYVLRKLWFSSRNEILKLEGWAKHKRAKNKNRKGMYGVYAYIARTGNIVLDGFIW